MKKLIDLHTHSTTSDGSYTPRELIKYAKEKGLSLIALTDHDTINGVEEAIEEGDRIGIEVMPGIEISVNGGREMHMLAYFTRDNYKSVDNMLNNLREAREERNIKMLDKLTQLGFPISLEEAKQEMNGEILARPHIANLMLKRGYVKSKDEAFEKYLGDGKIAFFSKGKISAKEAITTIKKFGGLPVLAHPVHLNVDNLKLEEIIIELKEYGLIGMEVFYADNTNQYTGFLSRLAIKYNIIGTGGSDFHGSNRERTDLGVGRGNLKIDYSVYEKLNQKFNTV
ncbi:MAG: PHP domain-containing protein [Clostridiales bacterium]